MLEVRVNNSIVKVSNRSFGPAAVRAALTVKYGNSRQKAVVTDGKTGYIVSSGGRIRKMTAEEEYDLI